jgi:8-oxo-dGTP pyrophosphatase MutT (NUDIX family)
MTSEYVLAILLVNGCYAMQLRDDRSDIDDPGLFGLFGGKIEKDECPEEAIAREIKEELCIQPDSISFLREIESGDSGLGNNRIYWLFEADVPTFWEGHELREGQATVIFPFSDLINQPMPQLIKDLIFWHRSRNRRN